MDIQILILALLREARDQGASALLKTTLVKFLYLLDVYTAERNDGVPVSDIEWRFLHFGPYAARITETLEDMAAHRLIEIEQKESEDGDKDFALYSLSAYRRVKNLREAGVPGPVQTKIHADLKRYAKNLPGLLDYVYFRTAPMKEASPGERLDFSSCERLKPEDINPVAMNKLSPVAIRRAREKLRTLIESRLAQEKIEQGPYDEIYYSALDELEGESLECGLRGRALLKL